MGFACDQDLVPLAENSTFADIFDYVRYDNASSSPCPAGFRSVNVGKPLSMSP